MKSAYSITLEVHIFKCICCVHEVNITSKICIISHISLTDTKTSNFSYLYVVWLDFILSCRGLIILHWSDYFVFPYFDRIALSNQFVKECNK